MVEQRCSNCGAAMPENRPVCSTCGHWNPVAAGSPVRPPGATTGKPVSVASAPTREPRTHARGRRLLLIVPAAILCIILAIGGIYAVRIYHVFQTVNSVSTPANEISGDALGGPADIKIDTGPAKTALAGGGGSGGGVSIAAAPSATGTSTVSSQAGATRTAPATVTPPLVTVTSTSVPGPIATLPPAATPTPTPVLSEIERVKNGDFEHANTNWYLEAGATIGTGDAHAGEGLLTISESGGYADQRVFFVAGTTYQLSAWAKLSAASVETGQIGITFFDASGKRNSAGAPPPVDITSTDWTNLIVSFTPPEGTAEVAVYFWKPSGEATLSIDDVSIRSVVPEAVLNVEVQESDENSLTILLMGVDARPGEAIDIGVRPDSLMVLHLNADTGSCHVLSIPRDTRTELPGYGMTKVNHALAVGGIEYEVQVVELLLGISINHYVLIDFDGFKDLVDAVGGITVDVPEQFTSSDGQVFMAGKQEMSGAEALSYARWRGGADGDFGRIQRQQQIIQALVARTSGLNIVRSIDELLPAVEANLRTDLSPAKMASIATDYSDRCTASTINLIRLEGSAATYNDPLLQLPLYYIEVDQAEIRQKVAALLEP